MRSQRRPRTRTRRRNRVQRVKTRTQKRVRKTKRTRKHSRKSKRRSRMRGGADEIIPQGTFSQVLTRGSEKWDNDCDQCATCGQVFSKTRTQKFANAIASNFSALSGHQYYSHKKHHCRGCGRCFCDSDGCCRKITAKPAPEPAEQAPAPAETELFCYECVEMQPGEKIAFGISDAE